MSLKSLILFIFLTQALYAGPKVLIDSKTIKAFDFFQKLQSAIEQSELELVPEKDATYDTHVILAKQIKYEADKTSFAVHFYKYKNQSDSKMLTISESDSKWLSMKPEKKDVFFKKMAGQIVRQLEIEAELRRGRKLNKGYFNNFGEVVSEYKEAPKPRKPLSVPKPRASLEVDVVNGTAPSAPLKDTPKPKKAIDDLVVSSNPPKVEEPKDIDEVLNQSVEEVDVVALQEKFEALEFQMASAEPERKSVLLTKQALVYVQIGDTDEALELLRLALELDGENAEAKKLRKKLLPPPPSMLERVRSFTKSKKLQLSLKQKYEYDSNIVLEAKDPTQPSNKDDAVYSATLGLGKFWGKGHITNYSFFVDVHAENEGFDIMAHTLSHSFSKKISDQLTLVLPLSFSHFTLEHEALLWMADLAPILVWKLDDSWTSMFELGYRDSSYFSESSNGLEAEQIRFKAGFLKAFDTKLKQNAKLQLVYLDESTNLKSVAYEQFGLNLDYVLVLEQKLLDKLNLGAMYHNRDYDEAAAGLAKRKDDRLTFKVGLSKAVFEGQSLELNFNWVDNDSNLNTSKYDKYKVGLGWNIFL